jgi:chromosome segregation ATPase
MTIKEEVKELKGEVSSLTKETVQLRTEVSDLKKETERLRLEVETLSKKAQQLKEMIQRVELGVCGDEDKGIEGLVKRVESHEKKIKAGEKIIWIVTGAITLISIVGSAISILK